MTGRWNARNRPWPGALVVVLLVGCGVADDESDGTTPVRPTIAVEAREPAAGADAAPDSSGPVIDVWYGDTQTSGAIGVPQPYFNVLGNVSDISGVTSLTYSLNGLPPTELSVGPDDRRLARVGDFNVDIPVTSLSVGANDVVIAAIDSRGNQASRKVQVILEDGNAWPIDYSIDWETVADITDVVQVVDGEWAIDRDGARALVPDYDRLLAIGEMGWSDYEVLVPVTVNALDHSAFDRPTSGHGAGIGFLMSWNGHTDEPIADWQPKTGWLPYGAIAFNWWTSASESHLRLEMDGAVVEETAAGTQRSVGSTYWYRVRVETTPDGSEYRVKMWEDGTTEPAGWTLRETTDEAASGSLLLIAHHVDASFGDLRITPLGS